VAEQRLAAMEDDVVVHYDPASPDDAYLHLNSPRLGYVLLAAGAVGVIVAVIELLG